MEAVAQALAAPQRRAILEIVRDHEVSAGGIAEHFDLTRPAISQHLKVLKDADLLYERRAGTRRLYRARPAGLAELHEFLESFWGDRLQLLKIEAEYEEQRRRDAS